MQHVMSSTRAVVPSTATFKVQRQHALRMRSSPRRGVAARRVFVTRAQEAKGFGKKSKTKVEQIKREEQKAAVDEYEENLEMQAQYREDERSAKLQGVPEVVSTRMLYRIIGFAGVPMVTGFALFPLFYYLKVLADTPVDVPVWFAYIASALTFGGAALGITYGALSASWDPRVKGSALGLEEFKQNVPIFLERFKRN
mmetsp:Transcript_18138/g.39670  ORF Transcript_18138/g.39670 Transcript_18138/m.39670 type:complete len:198 (-) Transcript_18138:210-803(-)|eukprot:CAMPEP_0118934908 /NCGR_PEP_ID=MMETSP1169-20130426/14467_1 /TAXON_ID=36882 /ORGANISM="Pyramimonas obovata, Strain CCMP722" /LENGTH=197 /DNA_ID=CAMNT_0006877869 /DNA_START=78 /DNA_END=671 /DNA_ORIENTATION=+